MRAGHRRSELRTSCVTSRVGVISERQAGTLRARARRDEPAAKRALRAAIELRDDVLYPIFRALADGNEPRRELLGRLRDRECEAFARAELGRSWTWPPPRELTDPLDPIVHAAVELLTDGPVERVKTCGNCRWLFLDQSRNRSRRWCSMDECGIEMKHARFVERRRVSRSRTAAAGTP